MIKLVFISNILDQSMIGFCDAIYKQNDIDFKFVTYKSKMSEVKTRSNIKRPYRHDYSKNVENEIIDVADALIIGHAPDYFIKKYRRHKLIFKSGERLFKEDILGFKKIKSLLSIIKHHGRYQCHNLRYLGIGNGAMDDIKKTHLYKRKAYKWVYFPEIDYSFDLNNIKEKFENDVNKINIIWAGRMVECKNIQTIIDCVKRATDNGFNIKLTLVGDGPLKCDLENSSYGYSNIEFLGLKPLEDTLELIKEANFLFMASDRREGWGMVVNNAINYGTIIIGNSCCGSVSTLLNSEDAFLYSKNEKAYETLIRAITTKNEILKNMAVKAYLDLVQKWSPQIGAKRFADKLKSIIIDKKEIYFEEGLFS